MHQQHQLCIHSTHVDLQTVSEHIKYMLFKLITSAIISVSAIFFVSSVYLRLTAVDVFSRHNKSSANSSAQPYTQAAYRGVPYSIGIGSL